MSLLPRLSVCMMVRDEAHTIRRCLSSIDGLYQELCVVDTGSIDDTESVVLEYGAKLLKISNCNDSEGRIVDFALARNTAISMATGDWILQIDADEVVEAELDYIHSLLRTTKSGGIGVTVISEGAQWISGRLFRRRPSLRYRGRVHEFMEGYGELRAASDIVIRNLPDKVGKESSGQRTRRICELALRDDPADARSLFYLGSELQGERRWDEAIECYKSVLAAGSYEAGMYHAAYSLGVCYLLADRLDASIDAAFTALKLDPRYAESHCLLGDAYHLQGALRHARQWYLSALACKRPPVGALFASQEWAYGAHPKRQLRKLRESTR